MLRRSHIISALSCLIIGIIGCGESAYFKDVYKPENKVWTHGELASFDFAITDTLARYDMYLDVTHTGSYPFQNLYVRIISTFPDGEQVTEQHSLELQEKNGEWVGDCGSKNCELRFILREGMRFDTPGEYNIAFEQFTRRDSLAGVVSLGLVLGRSEGK
jgi:gliding motility-associated lipoprotein GldH